jgi:hypothetical protein
MYAQQAQALITLMIACYRRIIIRLTYGTGISERNILDDGLLCYYYVKFDFEAKDSDPNLITYLCIVKQGLHIPQTIDDSLSRLSDQGNVLYDLAIKSVICTGGLV